MFRVFSSESSACVSSRFWFSLFVAVTICWIFAGSLEKDVPTRSSSFASGANPAASSRSLAANVATVAGSSAPIIAGRRFREFRMLLSPADFCTAERDFMAPASPLRLESAVEDACRDAKAVDSFVRLLATAVSFALSRSRRRESAKRSMFAAALPELDRICISRESIVVDTSAPPCYPRYITPFLSITPS